MPVDADSVDRFGVGACKLRGLQTDTRAHTSDINTHAHSGELLSRRWVMAPDFPLEFAGFFPRKKSRKTREKFGAFRGKCGKKNTGFFLAIQLRNCVLSYSYECFYVLTHTSPPPGLLRPAHPTRPTPTRRAPTWPAPTRPAHPHPARLHPARSSPLRHLQPNFSLRTEFFPGATRFFQGATGFFPGATGFFPRA